MMPDHIQCKFLSYPMRSACEVCDIISSDLKGGQLIIQMP